MAKIETWDLYTYHPSGDDGRRAVRSGYMGSLDEIPQLFRQQVTPGVWDFSQVYSPGASGSYAKSVLDDHNKRASLKPEGEGWAITGYKEVAPAQERDNFSGDYKAGAAYMGKPAKEAITVPIYSRVAPTPPSPPSATPPPPRPQVDPAVQAAAEGRYAEAADRARTYLAQGPTYAASQVTQTLPEGRSAPWYRDRMSNFFQQGAQRTEQQAEDMNSYARGSQNAYRAIADKSRDDSGRYSLESAKSLLPAPSLMDPDGLLAYVKRAGSEINYG